MTKKSNLYSIVNIFLLIVILITVIGTVNNVRASQRINHRISENVVQNVVHRQAMFHDKLFDIYVNEDQKFISVHGRVENWKELDEVEVHFNAVTPPEYRVYCDVDIDYR